MNKVVSFLQTPIIKQTPEQELAQKQREVSRITGKESDAPAENLPSAVSNSLWYDRHKPATSIP
jgi:hypothetical protein